MSKPDEKRFDIISRQTDEVIETATDQELTAMRKTEASDATARQAVRELIVRADSLIERADLTGQFEAEVGALSEAARKVELEFGLDAAHVRPADKPSVVDAERKPQVGDIVTFMTRAHPTMGEPYEVIGRVERDVRGMHAGNRYLPFDGVRIIEPAVGAEQKVVVEISGGVAECTQKPDGINVQIIDHDNEEHEMEMDR